MCVIETEERSYLVQHKVKKKQHDRASLTMLSSQCYKLPGSWTCMTGYPCICVRSRKNLGYWILDNAIYEINILKTLFMHAPALVKWSLYAFSEGNEKVITFCPR